MIFWSIPKKGFTETYPLKFQEEKDGNTIPVHFSH